MVQAEGTPINPRCVAFRSSNNPSFRLFL